MVELAPTDAQTPIPGETELERLVNRSRRIGADPTLVVHGGGNTSSKVRETDHLGRERDVLRIKGSGSDLKTIGPDGFPGLYLDDLLPLRDRTEMTDEAMVAHLARCMVDPASRRPSIETLLHAFLPARHVDHVHADAICALSNASNGDRHLRAALGPDVAIVSYIRPGFDLSRQVAAAADAGAGAVVLAKHGLVTWGERHEESYGRTIDLVARAEAYLAQRERPQPTAAPELDAAATEALLLTLRGIMSRDGRRVLHVDRGQRVFADRLDVEQVASAARATPDHMLRIGARSLVVSDPASAADAVAAYAARYEAYFGRHRHRLPDGLGMLSPLPHVALVPGLGCVAAGADARAARVSAEIAARSHLVTARTLDAFGAIDWLSEEDIFDFEYWPLELYKLQSAPPPRPLSGQIAVIKCGAAGLSEAVASRLAQEGAHVVLAGADADALRQIAATLPPATTRIADGDPVAAAIREFGGVDLVVALDVASEAELDRFRTAVARQGIGGAIVGLERADGATVDRDGRRYDGVRVNLARVADGADPRSVADVIAFLASAAAIDGAVVPVGA